MPLIKLDHITKYYGAGENRVKALSDISLEIEKGVFAAVTGASGSGKTTLLNLLGCLDVQSEGKYYLDGKYVGGLDRKELSDIRSRKIGFIFQNYGLIPDLTAGENVELPLIYRGIAEKERRELVKSALEKVSLLHRIDHKPTEMSGGQQQRTAIARAIAASPPVILADEPTGNLDKSSGNEVMRILRGMNREGKTVVIITHDESVASMAERIIRISDGKII